MFTKAIDELFDQQLVRLRAVHGPRADTAFTRLKDFKLDPKAIDAQVCQELKRIIKKKYDDPIGSSRLEGHGWTTQHIKDHMRRFLQSIMKQSGTTMKTLLEPESKLLSTIDQLNE